jgi:microcystin-dependent protein
MALVEGIIIVWSGAINEIPEGWLLCDGQNNTPDLRNRFVVSTGSNYAYNSTGGSADSINVSHTHGGYTAGSGGSHGHSFNAVFGTGGPAPTDVRAQVKFFNSGAATTINTSGPSGGNHSHSGATINNAGTSGVGKNLPPYYALAYIMKGAN